MHRPDVSAERAALTGRPGRVWRPGVTLSNAQVRTHAEKKRHAARGRVSACLGGGER